MSFNSPRVLLQHQYQAIATAFLLVSLSILLESYCNVVSRGLAFASEPLPFNSPRVLLQPPRQVKESLAELLFQFS